MSQVASINICQVCGGQDFYTIYQVTDTNQDVPGKWNIEVCSSCGLGRLEPMPSHEDINNFYQDVFYSSDGKRFRSWTEKLRAMYSKIRGHRLEKLLPEGKKLLDYGSGAGHFSAAQESRGWDVLSVDPYNSNANTSNICSINDGTITLNIPSNTYDAVTLWYVIEHLPNPRQAIKEFFRILRPGGILLLAQQNFSSLQARIFGPCWLILDPPRHLFQFAPNNLCMLAKQEGFELAYINHASLELGPYTILQSTLNYLVGNENYLFRFLKNKKLLSHNKTNKRILPLVFSIILSVVLAPLSLLAYWILLLFSSGDVFTIYLRKS